MSQMCITMKAKLFMVVREVKIEYSGLINFRKRESWTTIKFQIMEIYILVKRIPLEKEIEQKVIQN